MKKTWRYPLPVHRFRGILRSLVFPGGTQPSWKISEIPGGGGDV